MILFIKDDYLGEYDKWLKRSFLNIYKFPYHRFIMLIKEVKAREILDSGGYPTVEVELTTNDGTFIASVPAGTSTGKYEAVELRDKGKRYQGAGVLKAIDNINKIIAQKIQYLDVTKQKEIDKLLINLDNSKNKSNLGANAILAVSIAVCKAGATAKQTSVYEHLAFLSSNAKIKIPSPMILIIEGGKHANKSTDFQEFMIIPSDPNFRESLRKGTEVYHSVKEILLKRELNANVGYEGAFASPFKDNEKTLKLIIEGIKNVGNEKNIQFAIDAAASELYQNSMYKLKIGELSSKNLLEIYRKLMKSYPILSIEDPFDQKDLESWKAITKEYKEKMIVGDDLLVTDPQKIQSAIKKSYCNALLVKPNQIGTISETIEAVNLAKSTGWKIIVSHRSRETEDSFIADFAVGIGADYVKFGAPCRGERTAKYNQLLRISENLK